MRRAACVWPPRPSPPSLSLEPSSPSAIRAAEHVHQLGDLAPLLALVAGRDRAFDAMPDMVAQHLLLDLAQRGTHRADLGHDVDAVAILIDHAREPADLAFDPFQAFQRRGLGLLSHTSYIPPRGICCK